jgi:hypothetical protein
MKTSAIRLGIVFISLKFTAQVYNNPEKFKVGQVMEFHECQADSINPGSKGSGQVWDFSNLRKKSDELLMEKIIKISETKYKKKFKAADFAEKTRTAL